MIISVLLSLSSCNKLHKIFTALDTTFGLELISKNKGIFQIGQNEIYVHLIQVINE
jgi:hypothetical protein